jgi:hypothetical protein
VTTKCRLSGFFCGICQHYFASRQSHRTLLTFEQSPVKFLSCSNSTACGPLSLFLSKCFVEILPDAIVRLRVNYKGIQNLPAYSETFRTLLLQTRAIELAESLPNCQLHHQVDMLREEHSKNETPGRYVRWAPRWTKAIPTKHENKGR